MALVVTPLPPAPQRSMSPSVFAETADAFIAALPRLVSEINGLSIPGGGSDYVIDGSLSVGGQPNFSPPEYGIGMRVGTVGPNVSFQVLTKNPSTFGGGAVYLSGNVLTRSNGMGGLENVIQKSGVGTGTIALGDYGNGAITFFADPGGPSGTDSGSTARIRLDIAPGKSWRSISDNDMSLGTSIARFSQLFAGTTTISTSDARKKTGLRPLNNAEMEAALEMDSKFGIFQFLDSVEEKGDDARLHFGMTVQDACAIMESKGLDPLRYAFICYNRWDATPEGGDPLFKIPAVAAGDLWSFRTDQLMWFIFSALTQSLKSRVAALEEA